MSHLDRSSTPDPLAGQRADVLEVRVIDDQRQQIRRDGLHLQLAAEARILLFQGRRQLLRRGDRLAAGWPRHPRFRPARHCRWQTPLPRPPSPRSRRAVGGRTMHQSVLMRRAWRNESRRSVHSVPRTAVRTPDETNASEQDERNPGRESGAESPRAGDLAGASHSGIILGRQRLEHVKSLGGAGRRQGVLTVQRAYHYRQRSVNQRTSVSSQSGSQRRATIN